MLTTGRGGAEPFGEPPRLCRQDGVLVVAVKTPISDDGFQDHVEEMGFGPLRQLVRGRRRSGRRRSLRPPANGCAIRATWLRSLVPNSAAISGIENAIVMIWLIPIGSVGNRIQISICQRMQPESSASSSRTCGTCAMPTSALRTSGAMASSVTAITAETAPMRKSITARSRYKSAGSGDCPGIPVDLVKVQVAQRSAARVWTESAARKRRRTSASNFGAPICSARDNSLPDIHDVPKGTI